eukprot:1941616-Prymnesium_polylepis.2
MMNSLLRPSAPHTGWATPQVVSMPYKALGQGNELVEDDDLRLVRPWFHPQGLSRVPQTNCRCILAVRVRRARHSCRVADRVLRSDFAHCCGGRASAPHLFAAYGPAARVIAGGTTAVPSLPLA